MSVFQYPYVGVSNFICLREYLYASKKEVEYSFTNSILKLFISNPKSRKPLPEKNEKILGTTKFTTFRNCLKSSINFSITYSDFLYQIIFKIIRRFTMYIKKSQCLMKLHKSIDSKFII